MSDKYQWFDNKRFTRDEDTGYYLNSTIQKRMHVYVWEYYNGEVPNGCEIHHKDFDRSNNQIENLQCITVSEHKKLHANLLTEEQREWRRKNLEVNARPKASEWHKSEEGREWHRQQFEKTKEVLHRHTERKCLNCGKIFVGEVKSKFCSNACKSAYRRAQEVDLVERQCIICGNSFWADKNKDSQCCSRRCGAILGHKRRYESKIS